MSNTNDPNFGCVGGGNGFEEWACDDFNLLDYVGKDNSPFDPCFGHDDFDPNEDDEGLRKNHMIYSAIQINNALLPNDQPTDFSDQFSDVPYYDQSGMPIQMQNTMPMDDDYLIKENPMVPSTSKASPPIQNHKMVKLEVDHPTEFGHSNFDGVLEYDDQLSNTAQSECSSYTSKMKPRKYRIKPDSEKRNPHYRAKREKNNDAVRKSRDKAKRMQEEKDERLQYLEEETVRQGKLIDQLRTRNQFLETQLINMKRSCTCQRMPIR